MDAFARCFLLVFGQLAAGGFMALTVPPFHDLERGFYKSSAAVYLGAGIAILAGDTTLAVGAAHAGPQRWLEIGAWALFCVLAGTYVASLWGERARLRARAFTGTLFAGIAALTVAAQGYRTAGGVSLEAVLYPLSFVVSALLLGAVSTGMMLGHWYLIDPGLSIEPLVRILKLFVAAIVIQVVLGMVTAGLLWIGGSAATAADLQLLLRDHSTLLLVRVVAGPLAALALAAMIWRTLLIPQTMAATGLFYIATLAAIVGEIMGRFILFRTSLPM